MKLQYFHPDKKKWVNKLPKKFVDTLVKTRPKVSPLYIYPAGIIDTIKDRWEWQGLVVARNAIHARMLVVVEKEKRYGKNNHYRAEVDPKMKVIRTKEPIEPSVFDTTIFTEV